MSTLLNRCHRLNNPLYDEISFSNIIMQNIKLQLVFKICLVLNYNGVNAALFLNLELGMRCLPSFP